MTDKKNLFDESPDTVEMKGGVTGVTKVSKKAKMMLTIGALALLGFILFSIFTIESAETPTDAAKEDAAKNKGEQKLEAAVPGDLVTKVSDGQSSAGLPTNNPLDPNSPNALGEGVKVPLVETKKPGEAPITGNKAPAVPAPSPTITVSSTSSPEEKTIQQLKQQRAQLQQQAQNADLKAGGDTSSGNGGVGQNKPAMIADSQNNPGGTSNGVAAPPQAATQDDPNKQGRKEAFLRDAEAQPDKSYLKELKRAPLASCELKAGAIIPAALISGVNSDLPGQITGQVRENVYDTRTGKHVLVAQGTRASGTYDSQMAIGQSRLLAVWNRLVFADGSSFNLQGMPGSDQAGYAGFDGEVDNHYTKIFGGALMMSVISAGVQISQTPQAATANTAPSAGSTASAALGQQLGQVGTSMTQRNMQIQPTFTRGPGYRFNIMVTKDMVFPGKCE